MEFPEPYHSLTLREWRKQMKAHPRSYATIGVRAWLRDRRKWRLICHERGTVLSSARGKDCKASSTVGLS